MATPRNLKDVFVSYTYTLTSGATTQLGVGNSTGPLYNAGKFTVINDDGTNTNDTVWVGQSAAQCVIPLRAGVDFTLNTMSNSDIYVKGTSGNVLTVIGYRVK